MAYKKDYDEYLNTLEQEMYGLNDPESKGLYESWRGTNRVSDLELAMFMSDKLDHISRIMKASDELQCKDGRVQRIEKQTILEKKDKENQELRQEIDTLKGDIKELKEFLINKLS